MEKKVYAIDNMLSINESLISINGVAIDLKKIIPLGFKGKVLINIEKIGDIEDSYLSLKNNPAFHLKQKINSDIFFNLETNDNKVNDFYKENLNLNDVVGGELYIYSAIESPYFLENKNQNIKIELIDRSKVFNIYVLICSKDNLVVKKNNFQVFDSFGALGFVIVDFDMFDAFISKGDFSHDLIHEFTTTELANDLFDEGLMILSWGHVPWVYYLNSMNSEIMGELLGKPTNFTGCYKFKKGSGKYTVIPGNELKNWDECKKKNWPKIEIPGCGEYVHMSLHVKEALSQSDVNYPIPTFYLKRLENMAENNSPLLESTIF